MSLAVQARPVLQTSLRTVAIIIAAVAGLRWAGQAWSPDMSAVSPACADPVEWVHGAFARPGCIAELSASGCGPVQAGDRVRVNARGPCTIEPDGMRAAWMLAWNVPMNINRRSAAELAYVPHITEGLAHRIVAHRDQNGPYADLEALKALPGVGPKRIQQWRRYLRT